MRRMLLIAVSAIIMSLGPMFGQGIVLGTGYFNPFGSSQIRVAPGQLTTLFVSGLKTVLSQPLRATSLPLPNSLGGISVTIKEFIPFAMYSAPLLAVQQIPICSNAGATTPQSGLSADCLITAITLQIPYETEPPISAGPNPALLNPELHVSENGNASAAFTTIQPVNDNLHVLSTCDTFPPGQSTGDCYSVVTHGDGTLVNINAPARAAEVVVIYALGLGRTSPAVKTGQASPTPAAVVSSPVYVQFDFRPNATPSRPYINPLIMAAIPSPAPVFVGLTPELAGLYQINVRIPDTPPFTPACTGAAPTPFSGPVQSNLTINIGGLNSFDGAAICVAPG